LFFFRLLPLQRFPLTFGIGVLIFCHGLSIWPRVLVVLQNLGRTDHAGWALPPPPQIDGKRQYNCCAMKASGSAAIQETSAAGRQRATRSEGVWREAKEFAIPSPRINSFIIAEPAPAGYPRVDDLSQYPLTGLVGMVC
jgi:hypothetical protein